MSDNKSLDGEGDLRAPDEAARFVNDASQEEDVEALLSALQKVAREHGISKVAAASGLSRESLYRSLSKGGNPGIRSLHRIMSVLGLRLQVLPANVPTVFANEECKNMSQPGFSGGSPDPNMLMPIFEKEMKTLIDRTQDEIASLVRSAKASLDAAFVDTNVGSTADANTEANAQPEVPFELRAEDFIELKSKDPIAFTKTAPLILSALTDPQEIAAAFQSMVQALEQNAQPFDTFVGWPGGGRNLRVYWHQSVSLWSLSEAFGTSHPGYWFGLGNQNPAGRSQMAPDVQIGMVGSGSGRRFAGVFARDDEGRVYATHNGRFQVRYQRTSPEAFLLAHPNQNVATVRWPDGTERTHLVVAAVDDPQLVRDVSAFVHTVQAYKQTLRGQ